MWQSLPPGRAAAVLLPGLRRDCSAGAEAGVYAPQAEVVRGKIAPENRINTGNLVIDAFVSNHMSIAEKENIEFRTDIQVSLSMAHWQRCCPYCPYG